MKGGFPMKNMKKWLLHGLWLGAAILLAAAGIGSLLIGTDADAPAVWAGVMILLSGAMQCALTMLMRRNVFGDRSFLSKGVAAAAVGALVLGRAFISREVLRALVSMMVLMDGVNLLSGALAMRTDRVDGRWMLALAAAAQILLGAAGFLRPEILGALAAPITGVSLLCDGLTTALTWHMGMRWMTRVTAAQA